MKRWGVAAALWVLVVAAAWATLPPSGQLSVGDIAAEFGGSTPHSLSEYYRGGGLVPNIPANSAIPTSGQITISDFYGTTGTGPIPAVNGGMGSGAGAPPGPYGVTFQVNTDGTITGGTMVAWYVPTTGGIGSGYYARCVSVATISNPSGLAVSCFGPGGTGDTSLWQLSVSRTFGVSTGGSVVPGSNIFMATYRIYSDAGGTVQVSQLNVTMILTV